jgi:predicted histone-like DNA-binding protein
LPKKYYASPVYNVPITERELKKEIARFTTVSGPDIGAVFDAILELIPDLLKRGHIISLGDLGSFYATFDSTGQESEDQVTAQSINRARVRFRTGKWLKQAMANADFEKHSNGNGNGNGESNGRNAKTGS